MIINCPNCKAPQVTDTTTVCPHCGFEIARYIRERRDEAEQYHKALMQNAPKQKQNQSEIKPSVILIPSLIIGILCLIGGQTGGGVFMLVVAGVLMIIIGT